MLARVTPWRIYTCRCVYIFVHAWVSVYMCENSSKIYCHRTSKHSTNIEVQSYPSHAKSGNLYQWMFPNKFITSLKRKHKMKGKKSYQKLFQYVKRTQETDKFQKPWRNGNSEFCWMIIAAKCRYIQKNEKLPDGASKNAQKRVQQVKELLHQSLPEQ